jgi:hypothetical protein
MVVSAVLVWYRSEALATQGFCDTYGCTCSYDWQNNMVSAFCPVGCSQTVCSDAAFWCASEFCNQPGYEMDEVGCGTFSEDPPCLVYCSCRLIAR